MKFTAILQYEVPGNKTRSHVLASGKSFLSALNICSADANAFHSGNASLMKDVRNSSRTESTYKVLVAGVEESTEWYVIREEAE